MYNQLVYVVLLALIGPVMLAEEKSVVQKKLEQGLEKYLETGIETKELDELLQEVELPHLFRRGSRDFLDGVACTVCRAAMNVLLFARRQGVSEERIVGLLRKLCVWLKIESEPVCHGTIDANADTLLYIIDNKPTLTATRICSILLQERECGDSSREDWTIEIPPKVVVKDVPKPSNDKPLKILQLTDFHYDPGYMPGSNGACDEPVCCQKGSQPATPEDKAGYWGDYRNCDTPWHAIVDALDHIVKQHRDLDYVYFTGDIINHKVWDTDVTRNTEAIIRVLKKLKEVFGDIPVFPILGNHEPHPVNIFSAENITSMHLSTQWVFDVAADKWSQWLQEDTRSTILKGGYYSMLVKPGFRIVALNSNVCYTFNWWLLYDDVDPFGQLQWLVETLLQAEKNGEKVHILSHVPSGEGSCLFNWSLEYAKIIDRFANVIAAQFNGHTHNDETLIYFSQTNVAEPVSVAFNGGSVTSYSNLNPNYKVYDVDSSSLDVLDYETWMFDIPEANKEPEFLPKWYKLYSFKAEYNVTDERLTPKELATLVERMAKEATLTEKYFRMKHREANVIVNKGCDKDCEISNLCYMVTSVPGDKFHCELITTMYNSNRQ